MVVSSEPFLSCLELKQRLPCHAYGVFKSLMTSGAPEEDARAAFACLCFEQLFVDRTLCRTRSDCIPMLQYSYAAALGVVPDAIAT